MRNVKLKFSDRFSEVSR